MRHLGGLGPLARALVDGQQGQAGLGFERGVFQLAQRVFRAVQQAGLEEVECQRMLSAHAVGRWQVAAREQVFMDTHGAVVFAAAAEQVAQGEMQLRGVGVALDGLDEGIDRLILFLVEQEVQALEVGLGRAAVFHPELAQVKARREPAQHEGQRQAEQDPDDVKVHVRPDGLRWAGPTVGRSLEAEIVALPCGASTSAEPCPARRWPRPP